MISNSPAFTHIDAASNQPAMVDVSGKAVARHTATVPIMMVVGEKAMQHLIQGDIDTRKGPVLQTATIAGMMVAERKSGLIPFCHPTGLEDWRISITVNEADGLVIECDTIITSKTGVGMAALTGNDICKELLHSIGIRKTKLTEKTGGKSDFRISE